MAKVQNHGSLFRHFLLFFIFIFLWKTSQRNLLINLLDFSCTVSNLFCIHFEPHKWFFSSRQNKIRAETLKHCNGEFRTFVIDMFPLKWAKNGSFLCFCELKTIISQKGANSQLVLSWILTRSQLKSRKGSSTSWPLSEWSFQVSSQSRRCAFSYPFILNAQQRSTNSRIIVLSDSNLKSVTIIDC